MQHAICNIVFFYSDIDIQVYMKDLIKQREHKI